MLLAESALSPGQIWAPVVSAVLVAIITGLVTVATTRAHRDQSRRSAAEAQTSASIADDAAHALSIKNQVIEGLEQRVGQLEEANTQCEARCEVMQQEIQEMQTQMEEMTEALRDASLLEREFQHKKRGPNPGSPPDSPEA